MSKKEGNMSEWTGYCQEMAARRLAEERVAVWHNALSHQNGTRTSISFSNVPENDTPEEFFSWLSKAVSAEGGYITKEETCWRIDFAKAA